MKLFDWYRPKQKEDRPITWHYWPIKLGWCRNSCHALICWHGWSMHGSKQYPDASYKSYGWTIHIGALKIKFGR